MEFVKVPIYKLDENGNVLPNPIFHRSYDKFHSRCIEYPFAAAHLQGGQVLLDTGTAQSDPVWITWLEQLPMRVFALDYEKPSFKSERIHFISADLRELPFPSNTFDRILAISVIEHVGLEKPLIRSKELPAIDPDGDIKAFKELIRVLKPDGHLVTTFPFGVNEEIILNGVARTYNILSLRKFYKYAQPMLLKYYEYQYYKYEEIYEEYPEPKLSMRLFRHQIDLFVRPKKHKKKVSTGETMGIPGLVTWREVPLAQAKAMHRKHVDGVLCAVWRKN